jgi:hypothetical protein
MLDFLMDVEHGLLINMVTYGPEHEAKTQDPPVTTIPKLKNLYDVMYLEWAHQAAVKHQPVTTLKHMFVYDVQNDETKAAVDFAFGEELSEWECDR